MALDGASLRGSMRSTKSNVRDSFRLPDNLPSRSNSMRSSLRGRGGNSLQALPSNGNNNGPLNKVVPISDAKMDSGYQDISTMSSQPVQLQLNTTASV